MEIEVWKDIVGYEGLYQISNTRKVKRLERISFGRFYKEKIMKFTNNGGYEVVCLTKNKISKNYYVDNLMYQYFKKGE